MGNVQLFFHTIFLLLVWARMSCQKWEKYAQVPTRCLFSPFTDATLLITISFIRRSVSRVGQTSINCSVWTIKTGARFQRINISINWINHWFISRWFLIMSPCIKGLADVDADSFTHGWSVFERFSETKTVKVSEAHRVMWYTSGTLEPIQASRCIHQ